nr:MAG TPA: ATP synthase [Caudoviricetes sp.]
MQRLLRGVNEFRLHSFTTVYKWQSRDRIV